MVTGLSVPVRFRIVRFVRVSSGALFERQSAVCGASETPGKAIKRRYHSVPRFHRVACISVRPSVLVAVTGRANTQLKLDG